MKVTSVVTCKFKLLMNVGGLNFDRSIQGKLFGTLTSQTNKFLQFPPINKLTPNMLSQNIRTANFFL